MYPLPQTELSDHIPKKPHVTGVWDPQSRELLPVADLSEVSFGRSHRCHFQIGTPTVSRLHCVLKRLPPYWRLTNRSRNGTVVNDVLVRDSVLVGVGTYIDIAGRLFVTVGVDERVLIKAYGVVSHMAHAVELYGSTRKAGEAVGRSHMTVGRAYRARFPRRR